LQNGIRGTRVALFTVDPAQLPDFRRRREERGEQLYAEQKCALCHSIGDKGNKKGLLDGVGSKLSNDDLRQWIVDAKKMTAKTYATREPDMKNYALPKDDVDALVAYMASLKKK